MTSALVYPLPNALPLVSSLPSPVSVASPLPPSPTDALSTGTASRSVSVSPTASAATDLDSAFSPTSIGAATSGSDETDDAIASLPPLSPALSPRAMALPAAAVAKAKVEQLELPSLLSTTTSTTSTQSTVNLNMLDAALGMGMGLTLPLGGAPNFPPLTDEFEGLAFSMPLFSPSSTRHSAAATTTPSSAYAVTAAAAAAACNAPPVYPTPSALAPPPSAAMFPPLMPMALPMPTAGSTVQLQRYLAGLQLEMHHLQSQLAIAANVNTKLSAVSPTAPMAAAANDFKVKVERRSPQPPVPTAAVAGSLAAKYNLKHSPQLSSSNAKPKAAKSNKQHAGMKRERSPQSRSPSTDPFTSESDADSRISSPAGQLPRTLAYTAPRPAPAKPAKVSGGFVVAASKAVLVPRKSSSASLDASDPDNQISIGQYTRAERRAKIERYRAKRATRNFGKKISYGCRKNFADNRPRVGGRFISVPTGMFNGQSNSREIAAAAAASASSGSAAAAAAAAASTDAAVAAKASANAAAAGAPSTSNKRRRVNPVAAAVSAAPTPMQMVMAAQQQPMMQSLPLFV